MKNQINLILLQAISSLISGILVSKMSWIGKVGIGLIYRDYAILKNWWKAALLFFGVQLILILILNIIRWIAGIGAQKIGSFILLILSIVGLYYTYIDFTETSHKMLKTSFHAGFYLVWASVMISCLYFLFMRRKIKHQSTSTPAEES
ncbi:hypothetical protein [Ornithobacterium rhinotracheale]